MKKLFFVTVSSPGIPTSRRIIFHHQVLLIALGAALLVAAIGDQITFANTPGFAAKQDFATGVGPTSVRCAI